MSLKLLSLALATLTSVSAFAQVVPEEGKTYLLHRFSTTNSYICETGNALTSASKDNTLKQYWRFIPTGTANHYYIQNATTGRYIQSSNITSETQIKTGKTPVEYEIKANTTSGSAPYGYYYMCSTDQTIDVSQDGTLGLNWQQSTSRIVAYHIRYNRGNSYWDLEETDYDYVAPVVPKPTALGQRLGLYYLPCGSIGTAYLTQLDITGDNVENTLNYAATAMPSTYYNMVRKDSLQAASGTELTVDYAAAGLDEYHTLTFYTDWQNDGIFEEAQACGTTANGTFTLTIPEDAKEGRTRIRVRLNDNGEEEADAEVHGTIYDFFVFVQKPTVPTAIVSPTLRPATPATDAPAYGLDGRRVKLSQHKGIYVQAGKKHMK